MGSHVELKSHFCYSFNHLLPISHHFYNYPNLTLFKCTICAHTHCVEGYVNLCGLVTTARPKVGATALFSRSEIAT